MQLVIDLPPRAEQLAFNRRRWEELRADPELARIPGRIETNAHGQMICDEEGRLTFFTSTDGTTPDSGRCPDFPATI